MRLPKLQVPAVCLLMGLCAGLAPAQTTTSTAAPATGPASRAVTTRAVAPRATPEFARAPAPSVPEADRLAAESLLRSAESLLYSPAEMRGKAGRIVALARMADKLRPGDFDTNWLLAAIYQSGGDEEDTERVLGVCFASNPHDCLLGVRYLGLRKDMLDTAEARLAFLRSFVEKKQLPASLRAEAYAAMGLVFQGQGRTAEARSAYDEAVKLDPSQPEAWQGKLSLWKDATAADRLGATLSMIRGNPRSASLAEQAAVLLAQVGLARQSLPFYEHALRMVDLTGDRPLRRDILPRYCDAMLDANLAREAIIKFVPLLPETPSTELQFLLVEAYQVVNDPTRAVLMRASMRNALLDQEKASGNTGVFAGELARYYEDMDPDANLALSFARQAAQRAPEDPAVQRILGVAEIMQAGDKDAIAEGIKRLTPLAKTDVYAAKSLADYYLYTRGEAGNPQLGRQAIAEGLAAGRAGAGARKLAPMAVRNGVAIAPPAGAAEANDLYNGFDQRYLEMACSPAKYLSVTMQPAKDPVLPGEAIWIEAAMTNISLVEVPLGDWGLVEPRLGLQVGVGDIPDPFTNLPVLSWPAPRYLPSGAVLMSRVRLDVGAFARHLERQPLSDVALNILPTLDPVLRGDRFISSLPSLTVLPATLVRKAMVSLADANAERLREACATLLGHIVYDLQNGELPARMRAARKTASLLALRCLYDAGKVTLPKPVAATLVRGVLLRMVVEAMRDSSDLVRAEMLAALNLVPLDAGIVKLLQSSVVDVSPLVRMRLVELLGASGLSGQETIVAYFAKDRDELVRLMASAFAPAPKPGKG